jgi:hypothetical protein
MTHTLRIALATATAAALTGGLLTLTAGTATAADSTRIPQADFNDDGIGDVAFSAFGASVNAKSQAGQIIALYGTPEGVSDGDLTGDLSGDTPSDTISQNSNGVPGAAEAGDEFGFDSAYADFNGDGFDDLAVSAPGETVGTDTNGGQVVLLWGSADGLTAGPVITDPARSSHDFWGKTLAAGDFDGDGRDDLAVGSDTPTVHVFRGGFGPAGALGGRYTVKPPILGGDAGGPLNLTAGNVDGGLATDLVVDGFETQTGYGWNRNYFIPGTASGLDSSAAEALKPGVITAIGDIDADGHGDIVSGAYWNPTTQDGTSIPYSGKGGKVWVTYGSADGPRTGDATGITQSTAGVPGTAEGNDFFGYELDLGDVNGDRFLDLAIGVAGENLGDDTDTGSVTVLYGSASGLDTVTRAQSLHQDTAGVPGTGEDNDRFGLDVKLDDVTGDGRADLLVGSAENNGNGLVTFLPSTGTRITATGAGAVAPQWTNVSTSGYPYFGANFAD